MNERKRGEEDKPRFLGLGFSYLFGIRFIRLVNIFFVQFDFAFMGLEREIKIKN
jgi:hypothetical protein